VKIWFENETKIRIEGEESALRPFLVGLHAEVRTRNIRAAESSSQQTTIGKEGLDSKSMMV
jgi:hypothetical protein